jgi:hypothetical protein
MKQMMLIVLFSLLVGCIQVGPKSVPVSAPVPCPELKPVQCPVLPKYAMPGIPQVVTIKIRGDKVESDAGGDAMIRAYALAQKRLRGEQRPSNWTKNTPGWDW